MSFAEIVLRLGVAFVSWIIIYMNFVALLVVHIVQCPGGDESPWKMSIVTGVLAIGSAFALLYGHKLNGVTQARYLALPLVLLLPFGLWTVLPYLTGTTLDAAGVCDVRLAMSSGVSGAALWERAWAPLQLAALAALAWSGWRLWQLPAAED